MSLADWAAIAEIVAAIAVVVTLAYLAVQVRQNKKALDANTKAVRGQVISDVTRNVHEHCHMILQGQDVATALKSWASESDISPDDAILMDFFWTAIFVARQNEYFQWKQGLLDDTVFRSLHHVILTCLASSKGRYWWRQEASRILAPDFVKFVEELDRGSSSEPLESWKRTVRLSGAHGE